MLARLDRVEAVQEQRAANIQLTASSRSELEVVAAEDLTLRVEDRALLRDATFSILRGERVGIVGPNGSGKSTLLRAILGKRRVDGGHVRVGGKVSVGYHDQELSSVDPSRTVLEELAATRPTWPLETLRAHAGRFLFSGQEAERPIAGMSGGERARACLAKLTLAGFNLLVLDEPTNHLDTAAREALESALDGYDGTLVCVSHDRWFLERTCDRILWFTEDPAGGATLEDHKGTFLEAQQRRAEARSLPRQGPATGASSSGREANERRRAQANAKKAAERRIAAIDDAIVSLEARLDAAEAKLQAPDLAADYVALAKAQEAKDALEEELLTLLEERETLDEVVQADCSKP
jgi:ATP-binding cassette subfamily F protein 3